MVQINPQDHNPAYDELCSICYTSELREEPCVTLGCGHIFHTECIRNLLKHRWTTTRITFAFLDCPACKREITLGPDMAGTALQKELEKMKKLKT